jgi:hypothetical protein
MNFTRKIKAGLVKVDLNLFVGEYGTIFYNEDTGELRLSDGITPGGIPLGAGGGGGATLFRQLFDTPSTYVGSAGYFVKVKQDATGLEFVDQTIFDGDYNNLVNAPDLSVYQLISNAFSGNYNDLTNLPTLFSGSYNDLTDNPTLFSGDYNDLTNLPTLFSGSYNDLTDTPTPLSVGVVDTNNNLLSNTTDVIAIRFDTDSGFDVVDLGSGIVKVQMNSTFKTWKSPGEQDLVATGLDTVEFIANTGLDITLDPTASPYQQIIFTNTITSLNDLLDVDATSTTGQVLTSDGAGNFTFQTISGGGGGATSLNDLSDVSYDPVNTNIGDRLTWDGTQWIPDADGSTSNFGGSLLGVIIDMDINSDGDLLLHHIDTFNPDNAFITDEGYMIFTDNLGGGPNVTTDYIQTGYVQDGYVG